MSAGVYVCVCVCVRVRVRVVRFPRGGATVVGALKS